MAYYSKSRKRSKWVKTRYGWKLRSQLRGKKSSYRRKKRARNYAKLKISGDGLHYIPFRVSGFRYTAKGTIFPDNKNPKTTEDKKGNEWSKWNGKAYVNGIQQDVFGSYCHKLQKATIFVGGETWKVNTSRGTVWKKGQKKRRRRYYY